MLMAMTSKRRKTKKSHLFFCRHKQTRKLSFGSRNYNAKYTRIMVLKLNFFKIRNLFQTSHELKIPAITLMTHVHKFGEVFFSVLFTKQEKHRSIFFTVPLTKQERHHGSNFFIIFFLPCQHNWRPMGNDDQIALHSDCMMSNVLLEVASLSVLLQKHPTPRPLS